MSATNVVRVAIRVDIWETGSCQQCGRHKVSSFCQHVLRYFRKRRSFPPYLKNVCVHTYSVSRIVSKIPEYVWTRPKTRCRLDLSDIVFQLASWSCQLRSQTLVDRVYWLLLVAGFKRCGSLIVARTKERMSLLRRNADRAR